jgi:hypothetical protein
MKKGIVILNEAPTGGEFADGGTTTPVYTMRSR